MTATTPEDDARLRWSAVHPYVSVTIVECLSPNLPVNFDRLTAFLQKPGRNQAGRTVNIVAASSPDERAEAVFETLNQSEPGVDELQGFVTQQRHPPSWAGLDSGFTNVVHHLTITLRRGRLMAVHTTDDSARDRLLRWLDKDPKPPFQRIPPEVLESGLLRGQAKGFWLKGTHPRLTTKPDTKNTSGIQLQDTIDPHHDASFAMGSARAELPERPDLKVLKGVIGCTPGDSSVWFSSTAEFSTFLAAVTELLVLVDKELASGPSQDTFPHFAKPVTDLSSLTGAFEVTVTGPENLPPTASDGLRDAAAMLQDAVLTVDGNPKSARFLMNVDTTGGGTVAVTPKQSRTGVALDVGVDRTCPSALTPRPEVLDALEHASRLLTVYYRSGHTFDGGRVWEKRIPDAPFPNWAFEDFTHFWINQEKPAGTSARKIHEDTGTPGDLSLFGWVVRHFSDGWLICDDGPGEVADFVHVAPGGLLSLIHVKAAHSAAPGRRVSAQAFEVVVSQATKNIGYLDQRTLKPRLERPQSYQAGCWSYGTRKPDRTDFLDALECRDATDKKQVVIVQPHVSANTYDRLRHATSGDPSGNLLRLRLLENLLNSARATVTGSGADLVVIGSTT